MSAEPREPLEPDGRFPSGPWSGFFIQLGARFKTSVHLTFHEGSIDGCGADLVGDFTVKGTYDVRDGRASWTKSYLGMHRVFYKGYNEGRGIWGTWVIPGCPGGGFHIWPRGEGAGDEETVGEEVEEPETMSPAVAPTARTTVG